MIENKAKDESLSVIDVISVIRRQPRFCIRTLYDKTVIPSKYTKQHGSFKYRQSVIIIHTAHCHAGYPLRSEGTVCINMQNMRISEIKVFDSA